MVKNAYYILLFELMLLVTSVIGWKFSQKNFLIGVSGFILILIIFTIIFYRDPRRNIPQGDRCVVSPADGKVVRVTELSSVPFFPGKMVVITIYLSVWDVHVNRSPIGGKVTYIDYRKGRFYPAFRKEATEKNECNIIGLSGKYGFVFVKQIAGKVARRILCNLKLGDYIQKGERFGMILFGSKVELYIPSPFTARIFLGCKVKAGESIIGVIEDE
ncbi:phosphatidylserine decarboxylase [bacterium]|nr:phosphatidylserine decarboxylase [bacterium]